MALGVGEKEVQFITDRYNKFKTNFPLFRIMGQRSFREKEPLLVYADKERTKDRPEPIVAMGQITNIQQLYFGEMTKESSQSWKSCRFFF